MPLCQIHLREGKSDAYRAAIMDGIYNSLRATLDVPEDDQFMTITEHSDTNFRYGSCFGVERSADLIYIQMTIFDNRTKSQKAKLFAEIARQLKAKPGVEPSDLFINLIESAPENWSVGHGLAQFG